jgi:hypothetical protein
MSTAPIKLNMKMYQGSTFNEVLRWESDTKVYKPITAISQSAPIVVTSVGHGLTTGWRTKITNVGGMKEINSTENYNVVTTLTSDTLTFNDINSLAFTPYGTGGILEYYAPIDLTGYTARMQLRAKIDSTTTIDEYTSEGKIIIDNITKSIIILVPAIITAAYTFSTAVYSLEMVQTSTGTVTQVLTGTITLIKEVTR